MLDLIILLLLLLSLLIWIGYFIVTLWTYRKMPRLVKNPSEKSSRKLLLVSVIVPSRNEEDRIGECIKSLKAQTYSNLEILIVDDYSTDNTVEIIKSIVRKDKRFKILDLKSIKKEKLLGEWVGKSHAMQQGSIQARGEWLLFCDVDYVDHDPELIERAVEYVTENKLDLLSLVPRHMCKSFWEKVIQPIPLGLILAISPLAKVNKPESKVAIAFGCFMLIKHSVFDKVGGYKTIRSQIADDAEMAKLVKHSGFKLGLVNGQNMMKIRMYESFGEIWEGWSKNIFLGLVQKRRIQSKLLQILVVLIGATGIFGMMIFPFLIMIISGLLVLLTYLPQWQHLLLFSSLIWIFTIFVQFYVQKRYYIGNAKYAPLAFLGGIVTIGIFLNSAVKALSGVGVTWKGRTYSDKKQ